MLLFPGISHFSLTFQFYIVTPVPEKGPSFPPPSLFPPLKSSLSHLLAHSGSSFTQNSWPPKPPSAPTAKTTAATTSASAPCQAATAATVATVAEQPCPLRPYPGPFPCLRPLPRGLPSELPPTAPPRPGRPSRHPSGSSLPRRSSASALPEVRHSTALDPVSTRLHHMLSASRCGLRSAPRTESPGAMHTPTNLSPALAPQASRMTSPAAWSNGCFS